MEKKRHQGVSVGKTETVPDWPLWFLPPPTKEESGSKACSWMSGEGEAGVQRWCWACTHCSTFSRSRHKPWEGEALPFNEIQLDYWVDADYNKRDEQWMERVSC